MPLKFKLEKLEGLAEPVAALYVPNEDKTAYFLDVEGAVSTEKLAEFRDKNVTLLKEVDTLKASVDSFKGVDAKKYFELTKMEADGKLKTNEEIDKIINDRVGNMKTEYETTIGGLQKTVDVQGSQLSVMLVDNVVRDAASKNGVSGPAVDDILLRAKSVFKLVDGKPIPHDEKGNVVYSNDGTTPLSVVAWVTSLKKSASHLFPSSQGGGAPGGRQGGQGTENLTSLQKIAAGLAEKA